MRAKEFIIESTNFNLHWNIKFEDMLPLTQSRARIGVLRIVNIQEIFNKTPRRHGLDPTDPTGGKNQIDNRVSTAIQFWKDGGKMDPSIVGITNNQINFTDGRHRLVAAFQLGETEAPIIIVPADKLKLANEILHLRKL